MYKMRITLIAAALLGMLGAASSATFLRGESLINTTLAIYNASNASVTEAPPTTGSSSSGSSSSPTSSSGSGSTSTGGSSSSGSSSGSSGSSSGSGSSGSSSSSVPPSSSSGANTTSYTVHHPRYITRSYARRVGL